MRGVQRGAPAGRALLLTARTQLPLSVLTFLRARGAAARLAGAAGGNQRRGGERAARAAAGPGAPRAEGKQAGKQASKPSL